MKINIVIDYSYLCHSTWAVHNGYSKNTANSLKTSNQEVDFVQDLSSKFFHILNSLPKGGHVVVCGDSKSWRKSLLETYKESREDEKGNKPGMDVETKKKFYNIIGEFSGLLKDSGMIISRLPGCEGDDLLYRWANYFYNCGESTILVTGDGDMTQLVKGEKEPWIISWNNNSKYNRIFVSPTWKDNWLKNNPNDIFEFSMSSDRDTMARHIRDNGISILTACPDLVILTKILLGDDGDDVPSAWSFVTKDKKGQDKTVRVTEKKAETIISNIKEKYSLTDSTLLKLWNEPDFMEYLSGVVLRVAGDLDGAAERQKVKDNLDRNAKLVWLSDATLPMNVISSMDEHIFSSLTTTQPNRARWNRKSLFENTRFEISSGAPVSAMDPFFGLSLPSD